MQKNGTLILLIGILCTGCAQPEPEEKQAVNPYRDFGVDAGNVFLYYKDVDRATRFYAETLGMNIVVDYGYAKMLRASPTAYITLVDATKGMHAPDEPKTVAIALVTDQLEGWYAYLKKQGVEMKYAYKPAEGKPHNGFVAIDPEGYYLEFERFNVHPENEKFIPVLEKTETVYPEAGRTTTVPEGLGFKATIVWLYYRDLPGVRRFYEEVMGLEMIVDQGWTRIYPVSPSGYIGLVDESRGMHHYTEKKGVTVSFFTGELDSLEGWFDYLSHNDAVKMRSSEINAESPRYRAFVCYDPEGYYLEFDTFLDVEDNKALLGYLKNR